MEVIFHLCYSSRSYWCCCCEPLFQAWEQDKGAASRIKQTQHRGLAAKLIWIWGNFHSMHALSSQAAYREKRYNMNVSFVSEGIKHFNCLFLYKCMYQKKKEITRWRTKSSTCHPSLTFSLSKCKKQEIWWGQKIPPAKNTQFSDRQMTSCCHLISFLA